MRLTCFTLKGDQFHPVERIGGVVDLVISESNDQAIGNKLHVLAHGLKSATPQEMDIRLR